MCDHGDWCQDAANTELAHKAHREVGARETGGSTGEDGLSHVKVGGCKRICHMMRAY